MEFVLFLAMCIDIRRTIVPAVRRLIPTSPLQSAGKVTLHEITCTTTIAIFPVLRPLNTAAAVGWDDVKQTAHSYFSESEHCLELTIVEFSNGI